MKGYDHANANNRDGGSMDFLKNNLLTLSIFIISALSGLLIAVPGKISLYFYLYGSFILLLLVTLLLTAVFTYWLILKKKKRIRDPELQIRHQGISFAAWFAAHNLFWAFAATMSTWLLLIIFGPRGWVMIFSAGAWACLLFVFAGIFISRSYKMLGLCWQSTVPDGLDNFWQRTGSAIILYLRYENAVLLDQKQRTPLLWSISRIYDRKTSGGALRGVDLMNPSLPAQKMKSESIHRLKALAVLFTVTIVLAALPGILGLTTQSWASVPDGWPQGNYFPPSKNKTTQKKDQQQKEPRRENKTNKPLLASKNDSQSPYKKSNKNNTRPKQRVENNVEGEGKPVNNTFNKNPGQQQKQQAPQQGQQKQSQSPQGSKQDKQGQRAEQQQQNQPDPNTHQHSGQSNTQDQPDQKAGQGQQNQTNQQNQQKGEDRYKEQGQKAEQGQHGTPGQESQSKQEGRQNQLKPEKASTEAAKNAVEHAVKQAQQQDQQRKQQDAQSDGKKENQQKGQEAAQQDGKKENQADGQQAGANEGQQQNQDSGQQDDNRQGQQDQQQDGQSGQKGQAKDQQGGNQEGQQEGQQGGQQSGQQGSLKLDRNGNILRMGQPGQQLQLPNQKGQSSQGQDKGSGESPAGPGMGQGTGSPDAKPKTADSPSAEEALPPPPSRATEMVSLDLPTLSEDQSEQKGESIDRKTRDPNTIKPYDAPLNRFKSGKQNRKSTSPDQLLPNWIINLIKQNQKKK